MVVLLNIVFTHTYRGPMTDNYWRHRQEGFYFFYLFKLETVNNSAAKKTHWKKALNLRHHSIRLNKKKSDSLSVDIFVEYSEFL